MVRKRDIPFSVFKKQHCFTLFRRPGRKKKSWLNIFNLIISNFSEKYLAVTENVAFDVETGHVTPEKGGYFWRIHFILSFLKNILIYLAV